MAAIGAGAAAVMDAWVGALEDGGHAVPTPAQRAAFQAAVAPVTPEERCLYSEMKQVEKKIVGEDLASWCQSQLAKAEAARLCIFKFLCALLAIGILQMPTYTALSSLFNRILLGRGFPAITLGRLSQLVYESLVRLIPGIPNPPAALALPPLPPLVVAAIALVPPMLPPVGLQAYLWRVTQAIEVELRHTILSRIHQISDVSSSSSSTEVRQQHCHFHFYLYQHCQQNSLLIMLPNFSSPYPTSALADPSADASGAGVDADGYGASRPPRAKPPPREKPPPPGEDQGGGGFRDWIPGLFELVKKHMRPLCGAVQRRQACC